MSSIPVHTSYDTWTVEELIDSTSTNPRGNKKVTIPEFQRRLVWSRKKQEGLITSIKNGFPFGSLLVYRDSDTEGSAETFKLIDGLQRTQTLRQYTKHPNRGFSKANLTDGFIDVVAKEIDEFSDLDCLATRNKEKIRRRILEWVWDSRGFTEAAGWGIHALTDVLLLEMLELEEETFELFMARKVLLAAESNFRRRVERLLDSIQNVSDIGKVEVPVIIYSGPSDYLAEVFVLLNRAGIQLHRYEIYAAQWLSYRYLIQNSDIIDAIWNKYHELEGQGFALDVAAEAPDARSRLERRYTLFEYLFGLGQRLAVEYELFFKPVKVDQPSPFGFNLMSACIAGSVAEKYVRKLPENIRGLELSRLESCLLESINFVYELLYPILSVQRFGQSKIPHFHADLQIVSQIATAFRVRYNFNDLSEIDGWKSKRDALSKHLPMYYLYDILRENWKGAGDARLADVLTNDRYLMSPPPETIWLQVLNVWFRNNLNDRHHGQSYIRDDWPEYLLLRYVLADRFKTVQTFHVQHLMPISRLISPPSHYNEYLGPINTIGNLALVAELDYVDIGEVTFVEHLNKQRNIGAIRGPGRYNDDLQKWQRLLLCEAAMLPTALTQQEFESFLRNRFELLTHEFLTVWRDHIPKET